MSSPSILTALSSRRIATLLNSAAKRIIYAAPGIQIEAARVIVECSSRMLPEHITVSLDFDEHTLRMGYGSLDAVEQLKAAGIKPTHSPGLRSGVLIVDDRGWVFTPIALYLEPEPQSDETPNAIELTSPQVRELAIRLSPAAKQEALADAENQDEAQRIAAIPQETGVVPVSEDQYARVKQSIEIAPPVKFDIVRQVRVFEAYLQYVEIQLTGASIQKHRIRIPSSLQNLGAAKDLEGKLKTTFDLLEKGSKFSSKALEKELNQIRNNFSPSLGKTHGRVVLKMAKPHLEERLVEFRATLSKHQKFVQTELQTQIDESREQVVDYYLPLAMKNPPDALLGGLFDPDNNEEATQDWIHEQLDRVFPHAEALVQKMTLEVRFKDVTFETLNEPDFLDSLTAAFPRINWEKAYNEFKAAAEKG